MPSPLREGIYEHLLTRALEGALTASVPARADTGALSRAELPAWIARHFARELEGVLRDVGTEDGQLAVMHGLLERLTELAPSFDREDVAGLGGAPPARVLRALYRTAAPLRPASPLSSSTLLTRARTEPALGHELSREIASADRVDILAAFITVGGVRAVRQELEAAVRRGARVRVLTMVFTGTTEVNAVDALSALQGAEVRSTRDEGSNASERHSHARRNEARDPLRHPRQVGVELLTEHALSRLCDQFDALPLGDAVGGKCGACFGGRYFDSPGNG